MSVVRAFEAASDRKVPYDIGVRRAGDVAVCYANADRAAKEMGWRARRRLDEMCASAWLWEQNSDKFRTS